MLFNSYQYLFLFLPITLSVFFFLGRKISKNSAILWLVFASLFYYGWWNPTYLILIISSVVANFAVGRKIINIPKDRIRLRKILLIIGIILNLSLLAYFKYSIFFLENLSAIFGSAYSIDKIILPLAISFFTFQQIAYLVDTYEGAVAEYDFWHYALFVTFFPQLIAGPIVHHKEMMPQFMRDAVSSPQNRNIAIGLTILALGLFKKAVVADGVAPYATPVFDAAQSGANLTLFECWGGALAYTMQLYFDFSGYSDMAIGGARMFGIRLPLNFYSPYKATSIVEFWRRWHMTLSRFLRDYLYIPLGGNRKGQSRRYVNLMATMVIGGLWHGAGWTFVIWGGLHGTYLIVNHGWRWLCRYTGLDRFYTWASYRWAAWLVTFVTVVVGWVFFRSESFDAALIMIRGMAGLNGVALPSGILSRLDPNVSNFLASIGIESYLGGGRTFIVTYFWVGALMIMSLFAPNTVQIMRNYRPTINRFEEDTAGYVQSMRMVSNWIRWRPSPAWAGLMAVVAGFGILALSSISEFLYFQF